jgi:hypothetical protein
MIQPSSLPQESGQTAKILSHCAIQLDPLNIASGKKLSPTKNIQASHQIPICKVTAEVQESTLAGKNIGRC